MLIFVRQQAYPPLRDTLYDIISVLIGNYKGSVMIKVAPSPSLL